MTFLLILACGPAIWYLLPFCWRRICELRLDRKCRRLRVIVLTYDDGPGKKLTPKLAQLLERHGAKATFFVLGSRLVERPDVVSHLLGSRHEIGSHSFRHLNAWKANPYDVAADVSQGIRAVHACGGSKLFRPPHGKLTVAGLIQARLLGVRLGWWTVDTRDSWKPRHVDAILNELKRRGGGVVLMHDFDRFGVPGDHMKRVLSMTERILEFAQNEDFKVMTLGELMNTDRLKSPETSPGPPTPVK